MARPPDQKQLLVSLDFAIDKLDRIRTHLPELIRRREHEASDGYPSTSLGGGGGGSWGSSSTEAAALARPIPDPVAAFIDIIIGNVRDIDAKVQHADACLSNVLTAEAESRGRVSQSRHCGACDGVIDGDPDARSGLCGTDRKAWQRDRAASAEVLTRDVWAERRRIILEAKSVA